MKIGDKVKLTTKDKYLGVYVENEGIIEEYTPRREDLPHYTDEEYNRYHCYKFLLLLEDGTKRIICNDKYDEWYDVGGFGILEKTIKL